MVLLVERIAWRCAVLPQGLPPTDDVYLGGVIVMIQLQFVQVVDDQPCLDWLALFGYESIC